MIEIAQLQKVVQQNIVIDIPELNVAAGSITAVSGLTTPHKETFIQLLTGQTPPTAGHLRLDGLDPHQERTEFAQKVGFLPAEDGLYERLTVRQNLEFYCRLYGLPLDRAVAMLTQVGLQDKAQIRTQQLSPELARRLALGRALLHQPQILILVDPFHRSAQTTVEIITKLLRQQAEVGVAILLIADESAALTAVCQTIIIMNQGRYSHSYQPGDQPTPPANNLPFKIPARLEGKIALVNPADILFATSDDGRTYLHTYDGRIPTHLTLTEVEDRLARSGFFRAHRSYLVNLQHIKEMISYTRDSYTLILDGFQPDNNNPIEIPLSKTAARDLRDLLDF
ncbi:LytTR family transcriptional regulator DNA-binding domain-containing protein [Candidatus Leptofilum sp.]|uniref:LytTR family transcriptional regulator DNA-binding domain-containing protein n=1 Tax=Candidatus Leptofilum sp. TaxID=3241576 RepID=UPI003B5B952F